MVGEENLSGFLDNGKGGEEFVLDIVYDVCFVLVAIRFHVKQIIN